MVENNKHKGLGGFWLAAARIKVYFILVVVAAVVIALAVIVRSCGDTEVATVVDDKIDITPTQIVAMKEIGQWEFLSIEDEELVDTVRKGFFTDDVLTRIYFGTLRLGFDMRTVKDDWLLRDADTLRVTLPHITLLDNDFIDEARTKSFYESGSWTDKDRAEMYKRARAKMLNRCLTPENKARAEANATVQVSRMFNLMGFKYVDIGFE